MGNGVGTDFVPGEIASSIGDATLAAGQKAELYVNVVDNNGNPYAQELTLTFSSPCITRGDALITLLPSPVGATTAEYRANGCVGDDPVTATSSIDGSVLSATVTLNVASDITNGIEFIEATPNFIGLQGMGANTVAEVTFKVVGETGAAMQGAEVNFTLNAGSSDATLVNASGVSGSGGIVSTLVQSGHAAGVIVVTASIEADGRTISATSSQLISSTGIPDQNSLSLAASDLYPPSWRTDGITSTLTMRMADHFNNPVPDGTAVYFTTSGGAIEPGCLTENGACSVEWTSQNPRPQATSSITINPTTGVVTCGNGAPECRAGRVRILATSVGNESFLDVNMNGRFDPGIDTFLTNGNCDANVPVSSASHPTVACDDLGDAYLDTNFNGVWDNGEQVYNPNGVREAGNGIYNGILCSIDDHDAGLCSRDTVRVRDQHMLVMASHHAYYPIPGMPAGITLALGESGFYTFIVADENGNGMPAGTSISANTSLANNVTVNLFPETLGGSPEPSAVFMVVNTDDTNPASGYIAITIESGGVSLTVFIPVN